MPLAGHHAFRMLRALPPEITGNVGIAGACGRAVVRPCGFLAPFAPSGALVSKGAALRWVT